VVGHARPTDSPGGRCAPTSAVGAAFTPTAPSTSEDIARAARRRAQAGSAELVKLRQYFDHPPFVGDVPPIAIVAPHRPYRKNALALVLHRPHSFLPRPDPGCARLTSRPWGIASRLGPPPALGMTIYETRRGSRRPSAAQVPWREPDKLADHLCPPRQRQATKAGHHLARSGSSPKPHIEVGLGPRSRTLRQQAAGLGIAIRARAATAPNADPRLRDWRSTCIDRAPPPARDPGQSVRARMRHPAGLFGQRVVVYANSGLASEGLRR